MPKISFQAELENIAKNIVIPEIIGGINSGRALDGQDFPALEPETIKQKGHARPLIDTGKLRKSFIYKKRGTDAVVVTLSGDSKEIGGYLQEEGINSKSGKKYFNFFGISTKMEHLARLFMERVILNAIEKAKR
jgi:hypothetical protein